METADTGRGRRWRNAVIAAGAALGMTAAGLGIAAAQEEGATTTDPPAAAERERDAEGRRPFGAKGHFRRGAGAGPGIHGEFTTRAPGGGYQTLARQVGEVTAVSASSLTVKSEDGFTRTYAVGDGTLVNAGNDGIADVQVGDEVSVTAVVDGGTASAVDVHDLTRVRASHERWMPRPKHSPPGDRDRD